MNFLINLNNDIVRELRNIRYMFVQSEIALMPQFLERTSFFEHYCGWRQVGLRLNLWLLLPNVEWLLEFLGPSELVSDTWITFYQNWRRENCGNADKIEIFFFVRIWSCSNLSNDHSSFPMHTHDEVRNSLKNWWNIIRNSSNIY